MAVIVKGEFMKLKDILLYGLVFHSCFLMCYLPYSHR